MKIIAHKNDGNGLITNPVIVIAESSLIPIEEIFSGISPDLEPVIMDDSKLPNNKYIKSWNLNNGSVEIDMTIARNTFRNKVRNARMRNLSDLDVQFQRALETGANTEEIVTKKQTLRDLPEDPRINAAQTTEELDSLWESMGFISLGPLIE